MKKNNRECGGIYNTGKCVLSRKEFIAAGLNKQALSRNTQTIVCVSRLNEYGECELKPRKKK